MLLRFLCIIVAFVVGISVASIIPDVSQTARTVMESIPLPGLSQDTAQDGAKAAPKRGRVKNAHRGEEEDGHGHSREVAHEEEHEEGVLELAPEQIAAARIETAKVSEGTLVKRLTVPGTVLPAADRLGRVAAKVIGTVAEMNKQLGDPVAKNEVVAVLDSREVAEAKSELLAASVNFDLQTTLFEREQALFQKKASAEWQYLRARTAFSQAQLRVDLARQKLLALGVPDKEIAGLSPRSSGLQRYELRAPIAGRIVERLVNLGAQVGGESEPKELYGIADLSQVWVELAVPPRDLPSVKEGQAVEITAGGMNERTEGKVLFKSPLLHPGTRSARVVVQISNKSGVWQPGAFVTAAIVLEEQKAPLVVPKSALQTVGLDQIVFVRTPEGFKKREVVLGRTDGRATEILFGLDPGEEIAVANTFTLKAELGKSEASHEH